MQTHVKSEKYQLCLIRRCTIKSKPCLNYIAMKLLKLYIELTETKIDHVVWLHVLMNRKKVLTLSTSITGNDGSFLTLERGI